MDDSDLFSDEPLVTQARAGAKFQPKFKRKAKDKTSGSIPSKPPEVTKEEAATVVSAAIDAVQVVEPDNAVGDSKSSQVINPSQLAATGTLLAEAAVCDDTDSSFGRSVGEVIAMEDSDLFPDESLVTQAPAGAKFQPKFKPKPKAKAESSGSIPSKPPEITKDEAAPIASVAIDAVQVVEPDNTVDDSKSSQVINPSQLAATDSLHAEAAVCDDTNSSFERSVGEHADLISGLECLDPLHTQSSNNDGDILNDYEGNRTQEAGALPDIDTLDIMSDMKIASGRRAGKFKPKPRLQTSVLTSPPAVVESVVHTSNAQLVPSETVFGEGSIPDLPTDPVPNCSPVDSGSFIPPDPCTSECQLNEGPLNLAVASNSGVDVYVPAVPREVSPNIIERNTSPVSNPSRKSKRSSTRDKVNGNGKARKQLKEQVTNLQIVDDLEDGTCNDDGLAVELPHSCAITEVKDANNDDGNDNDVERNTSPVSNPSRKSKRSSTRDKVNGNGKARKQLKEQVTNLQIVDDLEDGTCNDDGLAVELPHSCAITEVKDANNDDGNDNDVERNTSPVSNPSRKSKRSSTRDKVNGNGKARKQLKEQVTNLQIVDDLEDGTCNDDGLAVELPHSCAITEVKDANNDDGNDNDEHNVEHVSAKRKTSKKRSKKPANGSEKPPQKSKRAKKGQKHEDVIEASDIPEKEQKKKFSHSSRRKRRFVDESLLNMPEDEIDFARVALKDLILLADYKERLAKKEAKALGVPLTDQSTQKTFDEENARDEESYIASEQDQGFTDDQVSGSAKSTSYFNYQTHMDKTPRVRWSKQDTELFYGAIRQFGPDFSLIEQLFPGRNRHQIKLKFKNEERRSPFKLSEALASRANDHSYFEKVIEQLRQVSGADLESNGDVSNDLTREEEEFTPGTNEEVEKTEQDEDVAVGDQEADVTDDHNSLKSDEMDDENEILSSYQSAF
ncbi:hypothetical protein HRI_004885800 [Hibiscus trionum]|uniref:SANT domain-containing protein n=1 Tax=Hibiscus trionum TaxID=183268 RepID=A0A9W7JCR9_HIBTR|nr:hypothetical protein HRI_004885800 [Hibiscus trionum]